MDEHFLLEHGWHKLPDHRFGLMLSPFNMLVLGLAEAVEWQHQTDEAMRCALEAVPEETFIQKPLGFSIAGGVISK